MNKPKLCLTLLNHWSYTGIGWSLGLESCAQSITDSLDMADYEPGVKTGINLDALTYELVAEQYPHVIRRLKRYLDAGQVELAGATFGQPMGSMVSGESNLRQMVVGQQTIARVLSSRVAVFLEEEEMSHPQIPQLAALAGYHYAGLAQCDTWGRHGAPRMEEPAIWWEGADGTRMLTVTNNELVFHPPMVTHDIDWLWSEAGRAAVERMRCGRTPIALKWTEFGWEKLAGRAINKFDPELFRTLSEEFDVSYVTVEEYLDGVAQDMATPVPVRRLSVDDFAKLLPWGVGGDQVRRFGREVEAVLLAAERFEAVAHLLGSGLDEVATLDKAWCNLLAAQSHDVSLCEYTRHQGVTPPANPVLDAHFQTWGSYGFRFMDEAMGGGREVLRRAVRTIAEQVETSVEPGRWAAVAFNPCGFVRDTVVSTGTLQLEELGVCTVQVHNAAGELVPMQLLAGERTKDGRLVCAEVAFAARALPSVGYDTYHLHFDGEVQSPVHSGLRIERDELVMENEFVRVALDPVSGAIRELRDRKTGREMLDGAARPFPTLTGEANGSSPLARPLNTPVEPYDTSLTQAQIVWLETGPVRARVRATHEYTRGLRFEITVTLTAVSPEVDVQVRVFADLPPKPGEAKVNGWQFPLEIHEGYWLQLTPAFAVESVLRDYPFGVELALKTTLTALSWLDLMAGDGSGLLVVHGGTQYFKRREDGSFANLVLREWESHFTGEFGWPRISTHRYVLRPHSGGFTNAERLQAAAGFDQKPLCVVLATSGGTLPKRRSFVEVEGEQAMLSAFRRPVMGERCCEIRLAESAGEGGTVRVKTTLPLNTAQPTDALGENPGPGVAAGVTFKLEPWEIKNLRLST